MVPSGVSSEESLNIPVQLFRGGKKTGGKCRSAYGGDENSSEVLVPPNPKELEMAARIGVFLTADNGVNAPSNSGSGCSRLSVGGATPWWIASTVKIASTDPAAPSR